MIAQIAINSKKHQQYESHNNKKNIYSGEPNSTPKRLEKRILGKESGWDMGPNY